MIKPLKTPINVLTGPSLMNVGKWLLSANNLPTLFPCCFIKKKRDDPRIHDKYVGVIEQERRFIKSSA